MKKRRWIAVFMAMAMALILSVVAFSACGDAKTTEAGSENSTASTGSGTATEAEFVLNFSSYDPAEASLSQFESAALKEIEEKSGGRIKINAYFSGTLLDAMDTWSGTSDGLADISSYYITLSSGVQPIGEIFTQYFTFPAADEVTMLERYRKVLTEIPEIRQETEKANMYLIDVFPPAGAVYIMNKDHPIKKPEDMKGLVIMAQGHYNDVLPSVGASGASLPPSDWYTSLERGVVDALTMNWAGIRDFGLEDLGNYYLTFGDNGTAYAGGMAFLMNLDTWNSLPPDLQQIVQECFEGASEKIAARDKEYAKEVQQAQVDAGKVFYHVEEADMQPWYDLAEKAVELWIKDADAQGLDGQGIWDKYEKIMSGN